MCLMALWVAMKDDTQMRGKLNARNWYQGDYVKGAFEQLLIVQLFHSNPATAFPMGNCNTILEQSVVDRGRHNREKFKWAALYYAD